MRFLPTVVNASLLVGIYAAPARLAQPRAELEVANSPLEARADTVTCIPKKSKKKQFKVDVAYAKGQMTKALFKAGKSGDPHSYNNGDHIKWGVKECDDAKASLWEYPVFWQGTKGASGQLEWAINTKTDKQPKKTPIRVVYVNQNGGAKYCGIMTHSEVTDNFQGKSFFLRCT